MRQCDRPLTKEELGEVLDVPRHVCFTSINYQVVNAGNMQNPNFVTGFTVNVVPDDNDPFIIEGFEMRWGRGIGHGVTPKEAKDKAVKDFFERSVPRELAQLKLDNKIREESQAEKKKQSEAFANLTLDDLFK